MYAWGSPTNAISTIAIFHFYFNEFAKVGEFALDFYVICRIHWIVEKFN